MRKRMGKVTTAVLMAAFVGLVTSSLRAGPGPWVEAADRSDISVPRLVTGMLKSVESKPNMPSARCGYHFELLVASGGGPVRVMVYDRTAPLDRLDDLVDREVEIVLDADNVARSIHLVGVKPQADDKLANLSLTRHC